MSKSGLLERLRELELKAQSTKPHSGSNDDNLSSSGKENEWSVKTPSCVQLSKPIRGGLKKCTAKSNLLYEQSPPDSGFVSEFATCSNNQPFSSLSSGISMHRAPQSCSNLPSVASVSSISSTRHSNSSANKSRQAKEHRGLFSYQSDGALRHMRSTSIDSPRQTPSLKDSKVLGRSTSNIGYQSSSSKQRETSNKNAVIEINERSYTVLGSLGSGGSSKVYQVLDRNDNKLCALKCVDLLRADDAMKEAHLNEIQLLKRLTSSGCVVKLYDYQLRKNYLYILMEKGDIDLASFLKTRRAEIDHLFIRYYWNEMLKCVSVIHKEGIVHRDLKPANFLFVKGALKLIDFGIASTLPSNKTSVMKESQMGTLSYMAPEVIKGTCDSDAEEDGDDPKRLFKVNRKADVWSLGCILYNMVYGYTPFQKYSSFFEKAKAITDRPVEFRAIDDKDLLDVMKRCLEKDSEKRASVEELLKHRYIKGKRRTNFDQSVMLQDDADFLKIAQDLQQRSPESCAKKLRDLMTKRGSVDRV